MRFSNEILGKVGRDVICEEGGLCQGSDRKPLSKGKAYRIPVDISSSLYYEQGRFYSIMRSAKGRFPRLKAGSGGWLPSAKRLRESGR